MPCQNPTCFMRVAAFADFNSTDPPDFATWLTELRAMLPALYPAQVQLVGSQEELNGHLPGCDVAIVESLRVGSEQLALAPAGNDLTGREQRGHDYEDKGS